MSLPFASRNPRKKLTFGVGLALMLSLVGLVGLNSSKVLAGDCDSNSIIWCGFSSRAQFINEVKANNDNHGHHDLQAIYRAYGLNSSDYSNFASHAVAGTAYKDGRIVVNGQTVATGTKSIGRNAANQGPGYFTQTINGVHYYGNTNDKAFAGNSIPVDVLFNKQGSVQFAVLTSCGNPIAGHNVASSAKCNLLRKTAVSGQANTYSFTASASKAGNAVITKYVYNFGDGSPTVTKTNPNEAVKHTYTKAGTFTASVTAFVNLPGNPNVPVTSTPCKTTIKVVLPFYQCLQLSGAILDKEKMKFSFVATAKFGNGATFTSADFNFGDGTSQNGVKPNGSTATVVHAYAKAGNYNASATLHFMANGKAVTAPTCKALVTPTTPPTPECKPNVPVGSPECLPPCQPGSNVPPESPQCQPPTLPNTGAGNTIALAGIVAVGGFLIYRQIIFRRHKAAFLAADRGTSPVLDQNAPFEEVPEEKAVRSTFRRRRQF